MDNDQITALSREHAEEIYPNLSDKIISRRTQEIKESERVIRFLLHRYCLVEKSKLKEMYKEAIEGNCELEKMQPQNTYAKNSILMKVGMNAGCAYTLKHLFPEIAKEVEE